MRAEGRTCFFNGRAMLAGILFLLFTSGMLKGQGGGIHPPRPIKVTVVENLAFGAFYTGAAGGTVTVDAGGSRTSSGDVVLLGMSVVFAPAHYTIRGNEGTWVSLTFSPLITLSGPGTMTFTLDSALPDFQFALEFHTPVDNHVYVGGTLTVGPPLSNPPGTYSGTFDITFNQE